LRDGRGKAELGIGLHALDHMCERHGVPVRARANVRSVNRRERSR